MIYVAIIAIFLYSVACWLRIKHESYFDGRDLLNIGLFVVTAVMAVFTYSAVNISRELKEADYGPNISLSDLIITIVDNGGTPVREISWSKGDLLENKTVKGIKEMKLNMRFRNTGKYAGYVELLGGETRYESYFVPAQSETGKLYTRDIEMDFGISLIGNIRSVSEKAAYKFAAYDSMGKLKDSFSVVIKCAQIPNLDDTFQLQCMPVK